MNRTILIVDHERFAREAICDHIEREGFTVIAAENGRAALEVVGRATVDLAVVELTLPDFDGMELLHRLRQVRPELPVLVLTALSSVSDAVEAIKRGATDYIAKPCDPHALTIQIRRILETSKLKDNLSVRLKVEQDRYSLDGLVGTSDALRSVVALARRVARSPTTILLRGESGTGKDHLARAIHCASDRASKLFMNVVCTAIPDQLLESELFGHERGTFTDAKRQRTGLFEVADGGTVFLDEIGDMSPALQAKLLHVLEYKTIRRIGGTEDIPVDVRIIAATNRDLEEAMHRQGFREDLFYRLSVMPIVLPPLRERPEDIAALAEHFTAALVHELRRDVRGISKAAMDKLRAYAWPGNVRELRNTIERALLLGDSHHIEADDVILGRGFLGPEATTQAGVRLPPQGCRLEDVERDLTIQALARSSGNRTEAARLLGISRDQVRYKIAKFSLH